MDSVVGCSTQLTHGTYTTSCSIIMCGWTEEGGDDLQPHNSTPWVVNWCVTWKLGKTQRSKTKRPLFGPMDGCNPGNSSAGWRFRWYFINKWYTQFHVRYERSLNATRVERKKTKEGACPAKRVRKWITSSFNFGFITCFRATKINSVIVWRLLPRKGAR